MCKIDRDIVLTKERRKKKVSRFIPLSIPNFEGNERKYVDDAIDQGWVSTGGAYITKLEEKMKEKGKKKGTVKKFLRIGSFDDLF